MIESLALLQERPQDAQKGRPARPQQAKRRGGTYQALLEPLALIKCERIGLPPPVTLHVEGLSDARALMTVFINSRLERIVQAQRETVPE